MACVASTASLSISIDGIRPRGATKKYLIQWDAKDANSMWLSLPPHHRLHSEEFRWQSYQGGSTSEGRAAGQGLGGQEEVDVAGSPT